MFVSNVTNLIGNTPLIKLGRASELTGCNILGKAEFLNPGQSVKDRAALKIIQEARKRDEISENGIVVEGTAGMHWSPFPFLCFFPDFFCLPFFNPRTDGDRRSAEMNRR